MEPTQCEQPVGRIGTWALRPSVGHNHLRAPHSATVLSNAPTSSAFSAMPVTSTPRALHSSLSS